MTIIIERLYTLEYPKIRFIQICERAAIPARLDIIIGIVSLLVEAVSLIKNKGRTF